MQDDDRHGGRRGAAARELWRARLPTGDEYVAYHLSHPHGYVADIHRARDGSVQRVCTRCRYYEALVENYRDKVVAQCDTLAARVRAEARTN